MTSPAAQPSIAQHSAGTAPDAPDEVARPRPAHTIFPGFDGLRAIAALLVIGVHSTFAAGFTTGPSHLGAYTARGEIGVAVFFLISGFLLYRPFAAAHLDGRPGPHLGSYLTRRFLRIVPLFWVALVVTSLLHPDFPVHGVTGFLQCAFFLQAYRVPWALQGVTQAWTLDIEVAFYLTLPLYAALIGRRRREAGSQLRVELVGLACLYAGSVVAHALFIRHQTGWAAGSHGWLPMWFDLFALGMGLAAVSAWYSRAGRMPRWSTLRGSGTACWVIAAALYWVASKHIGLGRDPIPTAPLTVRTELAEHLVYGLFALFLLLPAVFGDPRQGVVRRLLASRPMAFLGLVSYGMYLWHQFIIKQLIVHTGWKEFQIPVVEFFTTVAVVTVLVSAVTYVVVERPFIALGRDWARRLRERAAGFGGPVTPASG